MTVKLTRIDGVVEIVETNNYLVNSIKDLHPAIVRIDVYSGVRKIYTIRRKNLWWYKNITFNSAAVQDKLRQINQQMQQMQQAEMPQPMENTPENVG